ncbi:MAG: response regulator, partial [Candidatus Binatia bacterium]
MSEGRRTILIVEDEADIRELLRYNLEQEGFAILEAGDGELALSLARKHQPHLVLLDLMLPGMNGFEVCRVLRGEPKTEKLPVLMLTARATEVDKVLGLEIGAD